MMPLTDQLDSVALNLIRSGIPVLTGVSGGRDSMTLLTLLSELKDCSPVVCHVHHSLRPEADDEARFVRNYAAHLHLPCVWRQVNVKQLAHSKSISIEEAARLARQTLFHEWSKQFPGAIVALAHHRNDQQETALLHACRGGSGLHGMSSVSTWPNGLTVVRPLLEISREEITSYLTARGVPWKEDASNQSSEYVRNSLRHDVIPRLNAMFQRDTSLSFSRACRLEQKTSTALYQALDMMNLEDPQGRLYLPSVNLMPAELKQCAIHHYLQQKGIANLSEKVVLRVMRLLAADGPSRTALPGGKLAVRKEKRLLITDAPPINTAEQPPEDTAGGI